MNPRRPDRLVDELREQILDGRLAPDTPLREVALAETWEVSRHTVRAVLAGVAAERLVVIEPYRGARVARLDDAALVDLQQLRAALECEAVRLLRERHGDAWPHEVTAPIESALGALAAAEAEGSWPPVARAHSSVHLALVAAAGSPRIAEAYRALDAEILLMLLHVRPNYGPGDLCREHRAYLRDLPRRGEQAVREHLDHATQTILRSR